MKCNDNPPLLTIAIPTYNRAHYLAVNLQQLEREVADYANVVEIAVSDNCSDDETPEVVRSAATRGLSLRYVRNSRNMGSDYNIAQSFNQAQGQFVLLLGDDDMLVDGSIARITDILIRESPGVLVLRAFGFDRDFRCEQPRVSRSPRVFDDRIKFLGELGAQCTLISSLVINKTLLSGVDARDFCGGSLVQTHLALRAILASTRNVMTRDYLVAYKRYNSGGYDFSEVYVNKLNQVIEQCVGEGLPSSGADRLKRRLITSYYPFYLWKLRLQSPANMEQTWPRFVAVYKRYPLFWIMLAPILKLPRLLALLWGGIMVAVGRAMGGDLRRGLYFVFNKCRFMTREFFSKAVPK